MRRVWRIGLAMLLAGCGDSPTDQGPALGPISVEVEHFAVEQLDGELQGMSVQVRNHGRAGIYRVHFESPGERWYTIDPAEIDAEGAVLLAVALDTGGHPVQWVTIEAREPGKSWFISDCKGVADYVAPC